MFYIAETDTQLDFLKHFKRGYVDFITTHDYIHPNLTSLVAVYLHPLDHGKGYIIPINHEEGLNVEIERISDILSHYEQLYTVNKKEAMRHGDMQGGIDLSILYAMTYNEKLELPAPTKTYAQFYTKFRDHHRINQIIPLSKLHENSEERFKQLEKHISLDLPAGFPFYNNLATSVFYLVEQPGIRITPQAFIEAFKPRDPQLSIQHDTVFTSYILTNITSRPTNAFNAVNFAAIPKDFAHRDCFLPRNDFYVEFDYTGFHLQLIAEQIGYDFKGESPHRHLAKIMFGKEEISQEEYTQAKQVNFQAVYGRINKDYQNIEFFKKLQDFIQDLWRIYKEQGYVEDPISKRRYSESLLDMNPPKLLSYYIQSLETSNNIMVLKEALKYLRDKKSKIVLYVYDSYIVDFSKEDGKDTLEELQAILSRNGKLPTTFKYSKNLAF